MKPLVSKLPSVGTTIRTFASGMSSVRATPARAPNGACVDDHTVTPPPRHSASAT